MKQLIWKLILPLTIISFATCTKWWYVLPIDAPDTMLTGFPFPFVGSGWHTSMSLQIFMTEFIIDIMVYFAFWFLLIYSIDRYLRRIKVSKPLTVILLTFSGLIVTGTLFVASDSTNIFNVNRPWKMDVMRTGYKFTWQHQERPDFNEYVSRKKTQMNGRKKIPFRLDEGIYFEDSGSILKWGCELETLSAIDNPEVNEAETVFKWKDKKCFGGHLVNVTIIKDDYHNSQGKLEFVDFEQGRNDPWGVYNKYSEYFKEIIGEPSQYKLDLYDRPTALWNRDSLQIIIGVGERFVEFEIFRIHYGQRFWNLDE